MKAQDSSNQEFEKKITHINDQVSRVKFVVNEQRPGSPSNLEMNEFTE